jgi:hypothetical protein
MHPHIYHQLAKIKIADEIAWADRQRLARAASRERNRPIDFTSLKGRVRVRLLGWRRGSTSGPLPAGA